MKSHHFDCGNSTRGPIGFSARIKAESKAEATAKLVDFLENQTNEFVITEDEGDIEYVTVYFGSIRPSMIDEVNDIEENKS